MTTVCYQEFLPPLSCDPVVARKNMDHARRLPFETLSLQSHEENANTRVLLIGGGPSLNQVCDAEPLIKTLNSQKGLKVLAGTAHRLLDNVLLPDGADIWVFASDGSPINKEYFQPAQGIEYWPASTSSPEFLERLSGYNLKLWHPYVSGARYNAGDAAVCPGSSSVTAALALVSLQGYKNFEFFGVDGSVKGYAPNEYPLYSIDDLHTRAELNKIPNYAVAVNGREWIVPENFWWQAQELYDLTNHLRDSLGIQVKFHGNSLNSDMMNTPNMPYKIVFNPYEPSQKPGLFPEI